MGQLGLELAATHLRDLPVESIRVLFHEKQLGSYLICKFLLCCKSQEAKVTITKNTERLLSASINFPYE